MAKTRAQRKAERRAREARQARGGQPSGADESSAQHATQVPESGEVAEVEAVLETGAAPEELGEQVRPATDGEAELEAPAPSRADVGAPDAEPRESRRERRRREREEARVKQQRRAARERQPEVKERQRGPVIGFLVSCWAELKRVQWPNRDTLVQASAITIVFIAVAAAYLGALDAIFSFLVKRIL